MLFVKFCTPDEDGVHGRHVNSIVTTCFLPYSLVQAQRTSPRVSAPLPITHGAIVYDNTIPVPPD